MCPTLVGCVIFTCVSNYSLEFPGEEVCLRIDNTTSEAPKLYGRHFDHTDLLCSKITRESIDACKDYFRNDLTKQDWALMVELKKVFQIL